MKDVKGSMIYGILFVTLVSWFRGTSETSFPNTLVIPITNISKKFFSKFNRSQVWVALVTLFYVDVLATTGTMHTMSKIGGVHNNRVHIGSIPTATYMESSAGMREGGRTGLTAVVIGLYFFISLFFIPLFSSVPPWAIGPSLVLVGVMMMKVVKDINWADMRKQSLVF
ncbi:adenine/guanine permease AZG2 [Fagus crenata]